jgi:hypothetical protein
MMSITGYLADTCKVGHGAACCRYVMMGASGWSCGKLDPRFKVAIDQRAPMMNAKGDNCAGILDLDERSKAIGTDFNAPTGVG